MVLFLFATAVGLAKWLPKEHREHSNRRQQLRHSKKNKRKTMSVKVTSMVVVMMKIIRNIWKYKE